MRFEPLFQPILTGYGQTLLPVVTRSQEPDLRTIPSSAAIKQTKVKGNVWDLRRTVYAARPSQKPQGGKTKRSRRKVTGGLALVCQYWQYNAPSSDKFTVSQSKAFRECHQNGNREIKPSLHGIFRFGGFLLRWH
jgi:hypothetical protein